MSLHEKSILVSLTLTGIPSSRADKVITRDVLFQQNAEADAGRWLSRLWPREALEPVRGLDSQIRTYHYAKTLPWMDKGERIIASRTFSSYMDHMRELRFKRETLVQGFLDRYDDWVDRAREMRGDLFKPDEYPHRHDAIRRFRFELATSPVPAASDFRVALATEDMQEIRQNLENRVASAQQNATSDIYRRIAAPIAALVERLANPDGRFTEATLNALREMLTAIPDINILDDPEIENLRQTIQSQLCSINPETVSNSRSDRSSALLKANTILATMAPWMEPIPDQEANAA